MNAAQHVPAIAERKDDRLQVLPELDVALVAKHSWRDNADVLP